MSQTALSAPLQIEFRITDYCNLRCKYCYAMPFMGKKMELSDFKRIMEEVANMGIFLVYIAGGEPLLHPNFLEMLEYALQKGTSVAILTNATVITPDYAKRIKDLISEYNVPVAFQVSLDSVDEQANDSVRGLTRLVTEGIENLLAAGIRPSIASVVTKWNVDTIPKIVDKYYPRIKVFHIIPLIPTNRVLDHRPELMDEQIGKKIGELRGTLNELKLRYHDVQITALEDNDPFPGIPEVFSAKCSAGELQLIVQANLDVITCNFAPNIVVGNLKNSTLRETWNSKILAGVRANNKYPCMEPDASVIIGWKKTAENAETLISKFVMERVENSKEGRLQGNAICLN